MYNRSILLDKNHSFFHFGQRGTGKSYLLREIFEDNGLYINLFDSKLYRQLLSSPWKIRELIKAKKPNQNVVVIDEIQAY